MALFDVLPYAGALNRAPLREIFGWDRQSLAVALALSLTQVLAHTYRYHGLEE